MSMRLSEIRSRYSSKDEFFAAVESQLLRLAETQPDFRYSDDEYSRCSYNGPARVGTKQAGPDCKGCIFGQALQALGWDGDELDSRHGINLLIGDCPSSWTKVQECQDRGGTWAQAVSYLSTRGIDARDASEGSIT